MNRLNKIRVVLQLAVILLFICGCQNHKHNNSENIQSSSEVFSNESNSKSHTDIPDKVIDIQKENQRNHMEKEKILRENDTIAAIVNDIPIFQAEIEIRVSLNSTNRENFRIQLEAMDIPEQEKVKTWEKYAAEPLPDKEAVLKELIRERVIQLQVSQFNLFPSDEEVLASAQEQFTLMKDVPRIYEVTQMYMEIMGLTEEGYLSHLVEEQKKEMGRINLYNKMTEDFETETEKDQAFETFVNEWTAQADIQIISVENKQ